MRRLALPALALVLPLAKLVLVATLWRLHDIPPGPSALVALLPETGLGLALAWLGAHTQPGSIARLGLLGVALLLALATWVATAAWAFTGTIVPYELFARTATSPAIAMTALRSQDLQGPLLLWTGGFFALLLLSFALAALAARTVPRGALRSRGALAAALGLLVASALLTEPAEPVGRLAILAASAPEATEQTEGPAALDPATLRELAPPAARRAPPALPQLRNVLVLVLESIRYEPDSPFVTGFPEAIHFDRAYAHHPRSVKTLEALLFGIYPSPQRETAAWAIDQYDVSAMHAFPALLRERGFATTYLGSMDLKFENYLHTLDVAGVERAERVTGEENLTWGASAQAVLGRAAEVLEAGWSNHRPQLVIAWTTECHRPYDAAASGIREGTDLDRYRACAVLLAGAVRDLLERLRGSGVLDRTLVVMFGDHGQMLPGEHIGETAFGQHVYEEELHVPLLVVPPGGAPGHVAGEHDRRLFQLVDVPATVASAVGTPVPPDWVGRDLLDRAEPGRDFVVLMSLLDTRVQASVAASGEKVLRSRKGRVLAYDLNTDPREQHPAELAPGEVTSVDSRLRSYIAIASAGWHRHLIAEKAGRLSFQAKEVADFGRAGVCLRLRSGPDDSSIAVEPANRGRCGKRYRVRALEIIRLIPAQTFEGIAGLRLRLRLRLDEPPPPGPTPLRARARLGDARGAVTRPLDPVAGRWQDVTLTVAAPPTDAIESDGAEHGSIALHLVPVDQRLRYSLGAIELEPLSGSELEAAQRSDAATPPPASSSP